MAKFFKIAGIYGKGRVGVSVAATASNTNTKTFRKQVKNVGGKSAMVSRISKDEALRLSMKSKRRIYKLSAAGIKGKGFFKNIGR